jgi:diguanylate cyclase (GGDEF)-like protein
LGDDLFLIEDAQKDERFANNPWVTGDPFIRFYAGQPLKISAGLNLGTLCLIDTKPRTLSGEDQIMLKDLAAMIESELNALHLATIDQLTQLANRRGLYSIGDQVLRISARLKFTPMLVYFDLDGFKHINDTLGHDQGDQALVDFAALLSTNFRESDVIARIGGDEFAVLFANSDPQESLMIEHRLRDYVDAFNRDYQRAYQIEFSMGIVTHSTDHHGSVESMLKQADAIMYRQKQARRN